MNDPHVTDRERALEDLHVDPEPAFPRDEYSLRIERLHEAMESAHVDMLFLSAPDSICYIDGYQAEWYQGASPIHSEWYPASGIAVRLGETVPLHFEEEDELILARITTTGADLRTRRHEDNSLMEVIVEELDSRGWLRGRVGLEKWSGRPPRAYSELFQAALEGKGAAVVDATDVLRRVRLKKSPREIQCMREAQRIADIGMRAAIEHMAVDAAELDIYAEMTYAMAKAGGEFAAIPLPVISGKKSACLHALASRRRIQPGDIVNVDICGVINRYHANMARTVSIGAPAYEVAERIQKVANGARFASSILRPDLPVRDFLHDLKHYYAEEGILDEAWWIGGYELGISFPPDWVGGWFFDTWTDPGDDRFEAGIVSNLEGNFYLPQGAGAAMQINTMIFGEEDAAMIHGVPEDLIVID